MRAEVHTEFLALPPGERRNKRFSPGDIVEGEIARVAIDNGFAEEIDGEEEGSPAPGKPAAMTRPPAPSPRSLGESAKAKAAKGRATAKAEPEPQAADHDAERRGAGPFDDDDA